MDTTQVLQALLTNDTVLTYAATAIATVGGLIWTAFRASDWLKTRTTDKTNQALALGEQAVHDTYEEFVRDWKAAATDGKLTPEQRKAAEDLAWQKWLEMGKSLGYDIAKIFAPDLAGSLISKLVRKMSGTPTTPKSVQDLFPKAGA